MSARSLPVPDERADNPAAVREWLGLSRTALEHAAYAHLDAAPHLADAGLPRDQRDARDTALGVLEQAHELGKLLATSYEPSRHGSAV